MIFKNRKPKVNNVTAVKRRLVRTFAMVAITTSFIVFVAFSLKLVAEEDKQIALHLMSFESMAKKYYQLEPNKIIKITPNITAYYDPAQLPDRAKAEMPYKKNKVTRVKSYSEDGFMVFHSEFLSNGKVIPLYLDVDARAIEFGDDSWDILLVVSTLLMLFLVSVLSVSIKRMFDELMSPIVELSEQLADKDRSEFFVSESTIDEIKHLTNHLNSYTQMKERVVKQEMMFAKYASHELKTPIAIISGAASLQAMKEEDVVFQEKQRQRILDAANRMHSTVEILLNIVKQENIASNDECWSITEKDIPISELSKKTETNVNIDLSLDPNTTINLPPSVLKMIIKNLVNNSARFTDQGSITICISTDNISVKDTGSGLSDKNDTEHGLGLLIVRRLCRVYGWSFELKNNTDTQGCIAVISKNPLF
ncbi:ATP-binding protein [Enterovibrio calviensis]|uniref:ATP-binding protein n=1 Tax=Enterovibrio calviensis TaxID=91359 RepID=UPI0004864AEC|nr:HAMP domain-containing sensor histidine kinase [Enterovibrio calviensis]